MYGKTGVKYLQKYIKSKDYFLKLFEEVGELAKAVQKDILHQNEAITMM